MGIFDFFKNFKRKKKPEQKEPATPAPVVTKKPEQPKIVESSQVSQKVTTKAKQLVKKDDTKDAYKVLLRRLTTEKIEGMGKQHKYVFEVSHNANKIAIKQALQHVYGITPVKIQVINKPAKSVRFGRFKGFQSQSRKAIVTLTKEETLPQSE